MTRTQFQIQYLMMKNTKEALTSLLLFVAALFLTAVAPSLLLRYVYAGQQLMTEPKLLQYIPLVSALVSSLYFVYAFLACIVRSNKIRQLFNQVTMMDDLDVDTQLTEAEVAELESIVDDAISKKKSVKKTTRRRSTQKTTRATKGTKTRKTTKRKTKKS